MVEGVADTEGSMQRALLETAMFETELFETTAQLAA